MQAPPTLTKFPRGQSGANDDPGKKTKKSEDVLSAAQKRQMEAERERVIKHYREMRDAQREKSEKDRAGKKES